MKIWNRAFTGEPLCSSNMLHDQVLIPLLVQFLVVVNTISEQSFSVLVCAVVPPHCNKCISVPYITMNHALKNCIIE